MVTAMLTHNTPAAPQDAKAALEALRKETARVEAELRSSSVLIQISPEREIMDVILTIQAAFLAKGNTAAARRWGWVC